MKSKIMFKNANGIRIFFQNGSPVVACGKSRFFPDKWDLDRWSFSEGPIRELHVDAEGWLTLIVWR